MGFLNEYVYSYNKGFGNDVGICRNLEVKVVRKSLNICLSKSYWLYLKVVIV